MMLVTIPPLLVVPARLVPLAPRKRNLLERADLKTTCWTRWSRRTRLSGTWRPTPGSHQKGHQSPHGEVNKKNDRAGISPTKARAATTAQTRDMQAFYEASQDPNSS